MDDLNLPLEGTVYHKQDEDHLTETNKIHNADNNDDTDDESTSTHNDLFEVEAIIAHKKVKGIDKWRIRWFGYGPEDDTWEPRENLYGDNVLFMLDEFETRRKEREQQRKEKERIKNKALQKKQTEKEKKSDEEVDDESEDEDLDDSNIEGWFGIKRDQGTLEQRRLFVADRRLSKTEKLLNEINSSPGVRVLRNQLKNQFNEKEVSECKEQTKRKRGKFTKEFGPEYDLFTPESSPVKTFTNNEQKKLRKNLAKKISKQRQADYCEPVPIENNKKEETIDEPKHPIEVLQKKTGIITHKSESLKDVIKNKISKTVSTLESTREFGISKNLKAAYIHKRFQAKQDISKRLNEHVEPPIVDASKLINKEKKQSKSLKDGVGTKMGQNNSLEGQLKILSEGSNIFTESDKIWKKIQAKKIDIQKISQEIFEELVMDGKVERVREILMLNSQQSVLDLNYADKHGKTLIHRLCEIRCGVSHTQCELINLLVSNGARLDIREPNNGQIPLHIAIANRRLCHVRKLLSLQSPVNLSDHNNKSPIMLALECSSDNDFLKFLLKAGASFQNAYEKICKDREQRYKKQARIITEHETRLRRALNSARDNVTLNMLTRCISPIFVNPLYESEMNHTFNLNTQPQLPGVDYAYMLFFGLADFVFDDRDKDSCCLIEARMWGRNPVIKTSINGKECKPLKQGNCFAFLCVPCRERNQLNITIDPEMRQSKLMLLSQMVLVQFLAQQSTRTTRNDF